MYYCLLLLLVLGLSACSDDLSSSSNDVSDITEVSSASEDSVPENEPGLPFVGGNVVISEIDPINANGFACTPVQVEIRQCKDCSGFVLVGLYVGKRCS